MIGRPILPHLTAAIGLLLAGAMLLPAVQGPFVSDDLTYIVDNETLRNIPLSQPWKLFAGRTNPLEYLPVRDLSYRLDIGLFGDEPLGYHLHNLLLYLLCCGVIWPLVRSLERLLNASRAGERDRIEAEDGAWLATVVVLLFAFHPAHVEAAAWISGRKDLLAALFALLSLLSYTWAIQSGRVRIVPLVLACLLFVLALFSKSTAVLLPLPMLLLTLACCRRGELSTGEQLRLSLATVPLLLLAGLSTLVHLSVGKSSHMVLSSGDERLLELGETMHNAVQILGGHLQVALAPHSMRLTYDALSPGVDGLLTTALGILALLLCLYCLYATVRRASLPALGFAFFVLMLVPVLQLIPFSTWSLVSERFIYLPSFGLALVLAVGLRRLPRSAGLIALAAICGSCLWLSFDRAADWISPMRLLEANASSSVGHHYAQFIFIKEGLVPQNRCGEARVRVKGVRSQLARDYLSAYVDAECRGDERRNPDDLAQLAGGLLKLTQALESPPTGDERRDIPLHVLRMKLDEFATTHYMMLLQSDPKNPGIAFNAAIHMARVRMNGMAILYFRRAAESPAFAKSNRARAWSKMGQIYLDIGEFESAEQAFKAALAAHRDSWRSAFYLAQMLYRRGDSKHAEQMTELFVRRARAVGVPQTTIDEMRTQLR